MCATCHTPPPFSVLSRSRSDQLEIEPAREESAGCGSQIQSELNMAPGWKREDYRQPWHILLTSQVAGWGPLNFFFFLSLKMSLGPGEMAQGSSVFAAFTESLGLFLAPKYGGSQLLVTPASGDLTRARVCTCACVCVCGASAGEIQRSRVKGHLLQPREV